MGLTRDQFDAIEQDPSLVKMLADQRSSGE
jgi:hypothetical protein